MNKDLDLTFFLSPCFWSKFPLLCYVFLLTSHFSLWSPVVHFLPLPGKFPDFSYPAWPFPEPSLPESMNKVKTHPFYGSLFRAYLFPCNVTQMMLAEHKGNLCQMNVCVFVFIKTHIHSEKSKPPFLHLQSPSTLREHHSATYFSHF